MGKVIWLVQMDRFANESRAKSEEGRLFSVIETADLLIREYEKQKKKPEIQVPFVGIGIALFGYLKEKKIPCIAIYPALISRIGGADILKYKEKV